MLATQQSGYGTRRLQTDEYRRMEGFTTFANLDKYDSSSLVTRLTSDVTRTPLQWALPYAWTVLVMGLVMAFIMSQSWQ